MAVQWLNEASYCVLTSVFFLTFSTFLYSQNGVSGCGANHYSDNYQPTILKNLSDLPYFIGDSVKKNIIDKVGLDFFALLNFENGLVIDYNDLIKKDPKVLNYKWKIPTYDLSFYISQKQVGIEYYCSRVTLDSNGNVIDQIYFPAVTSNPKNAHFDKIEHIKEIAKKHGFDTNDYLVDITDNHIVLIFTRSKRKYYLTLEISAHSGQIIKESRYKLKRKYDL